jgi:hypothetical protein
MYPGEPERTVARGTEDQRGPKERERSERTGEGEASLGHVGLGGLLVRVGSVAEGELLGAGDEVGLLLSGSGGDGVSGRVLAAEVVGDGRVVSGSLGEGL